MKKLLLVLLLSSGCTTSVYYKIPRAGKNYIIQREIIGYSCPAGLYLDMRAFRCQRDIYSGYLELGSTQLNVSADTIVMPYDKNLIEVRQ